MRAPFGIEQRQAGASRLRRAGLSVILLAAGCAWNSGAPPVESTPEPIAAPPVEPVQAPIPPVAAAPRSVGLVVSGPIPRYTAVADAVSAQLSGPWARYAIADHNRGRIRRNVLDAGHDALIVIGAEAFELFADTDERLIYCQLFEPDAQITGEHTGVAPLPGYRAQLEFWRTRTPTLARVGMITSPRTAAEREALRAAGAALGIGVSEQSVESDMELLYVFRRMVPDIDGFLVYPDTRVLSPGVLAELIAYARKHQVEVLTYNRVIMKLGADLLISADPEEIAAQTMAALSRKATDPALLLPLETVVAEPAVHAAERPKRVERTR